MGVPPPPAGDGRARRLWRLQRRPRRRAARRGPLGGAAGIAGSAPAGRGGAGRLGRAPPPGAGSNVALGVALLAAAPWVGPLALLAALPLAGAALVFWTARRLQASVQS